MKTLIVSASVVLSLCGIATLLLHKDAREKETTYIHSVFVDATGDRGRALQSSANDLVSGLGFMSRLFEVRSYADFTNKDFLGLVDPMQRLYPEASVFSLAPLVMNSSRFEFERVWGGKISSTPRVSPFYFPNLFSTAFKNVTSSPFYLYDVASIGTEAARIRRAAVIAAVGNGVPTSTGRLGAITAAGTRTGISTDLFSPVFPLAVNASKMSPEDRWANVLGVFRVTINLELLVQKVVHMSSLPHVTATFVDVTDEAVAGSTVNASAFAVDSSGLTLQTAQTVTLIADAEITISSEFTLGGRTWRCTYYASPDFVSSRRTAAPVTILIVMLVLMALLAAVFVLLFVQMRSSARRVEEKAAEALEASRQVMLAMRMAQEKTLRYACHELRNPLHAIMATLDFLLTDGSLTPEQAADVNVIYLSASTMQRLVNDVLDLAKLRDGTLKIEPEPTSVVSLMDDIVTAYGSMAALGVRFYHMIADNVPNILCMDPMRIRQVLANGVTNALKHTTSGEVVLQVDMTVLPNGGAGVLFQVMDTGPGLKGKHYRTLFDPAQEFDWTTVYTDADIAGIGSRMPTGDSGGSMQHKKTNLVSVIGTGRSDSYSSGTAFARQGSNFGLPIALNLAKLMNGGIGIVQKSGRTIFWFVIPIGASGPSCVDVEPYEMGASDPRRSSTMVSATSRRSLSRSCDVVVDPAAGGSAAVTFDDITDCASGGDDVHIDDGCTMAQPHVDSSNCLVNPPHQSTTDAGAASVIEADPRDASKPRRASRQYLKQQRSSRVAPEATPDPMSPSLKGSTQAPADKRAGARNRSLIITSMNSRPEWSPRTPLAAAAPVAPSETATAIAPVASSVPVGPVAGSACGRSLHVLLVDDEMVNRNVARRMLQRLGYTTVELVDGDEVMNALVAAGNLQPRVPDDSEDVHADSLNMIIESSSTSSMARFDVVMMDIQMRRMNGDAACQLIRDAGCDLIVIASTGNCSDVEMGAYLDAGFDAVLRKPFSITEIKAIMDKLIPPSTQAG